MSIIFFDGFETVSGLTGLANQATVIPEVNKRWTSIGQSISPTTDSPFLIDDFVSEGFALQMGVDTLGNTTNALFELPSAYQLAPGSSLQVLRVGFRFHVPTTTRTTTFFSVRGKLSAPSSPTAQISLSLANDNKDIEVECFTGIATSDTFTISNVLTKTTWHYIEIEFKAAESGDSGKVIVWVDDVLKLTQDPQDCNAALVLAGHWDLIWNGEDGSTSDFIAIDDVYVQDTETTPNTARLTPVRVRPLPPTSDHLSEWDNGVNMTLATTLNAASETILDVGTGGIPPDALQTGTLRVTLDNGNPRDINYTSHDNDDEFTIVDESWTNPNDATAGVNVFLGSFGNNFSKIDENGNDANDYVETDISQKRERYNITDLETTSNKPVISVKVEAEARNETGGTPTLTLEIQSNASVSSSEKTVSDTVNFTVFNHSVELEPSTSLQWQAVDIDNIRAGYLFDNKVS